MQDLNGWSRQLLIAFTSISILHLCLKEYLSEIGKVQNFGVGFHIFVPQCVIYALFLQNLQAYLQSQPLCIGGSKWRAPGRHGTILSTLIVSFHQISPVTKFWDAGCIATERLPRWPTAHVNRCFSTAEGCCFLNITSTAKPSLVVGTAVTTSAGTTNATAAFPLSRI